MAEIDWSKYGQVEEPEEEKKKEIDWSTYGEPKQDDTPIRDWLKTFYKGRQKVEDIEITPEIKKRYERYAEAKSKEEKPMPPSAREMAIGMTPVGQAGMAGQNILQSGTKAAASAADMLAYLALSQGRSARYAPEARRGEVPPDVAGALMPEISRDLGTIRAGAELLKREKGLPEGFSQKAMDTLGTLGFDIPFKYSTKLAMPIMAAEGFVQGARSGQTAEDYEQRILADLGGQVVPDERTVEQKIADSLRGGAASTGQAVALGALGKAVKPLPKVLRPVGEGTGMAAMTAATGGDLEDVLVSFGLGGYFGAKKMKHPGKTINEFFGDVKARLGRKTTPIEDAKIREFAQQKMAEVESEAIPITPGITEDGIRSRAERGLEEMLEAKPKPPTVPKQAPETPQISPAKEKTKWSGKVYRGVGEKPADNGDLGIGTYHTTDKSSAKEYGQVKELDIELKNPLYLTAKEASDLVNEYGTVRGKPEERLAASTKLTKDMRDRGYDGIIADHYDTNGTTILKFPTEAIPEAKVAEKAPPQAPQVPTQEPTEPTKDISHGGVNEGKVGIEVINRAPEVVVNKDGSTTTGKFGDEGVVKVYENGGTAYRRVATDESKWESFGKGPSREVTDPELIAKLNAAGPSRRYIEQPEVEIRGGLAPTEAERTALGIKDIPAATGEMKNKPRSVTVKPEPPAPPAEGKTKISQVVTNTFAKEFGGKTAEELSKDFAEYPVRDPLRAPQELLNDGIELTTQKLLGKERWDEYDHLKANIIREQAARNAKSPEELANNAGLLEIMRRSKEGLSEAGKILETAAEVDPVKEPIRAAEQKLNQQIKASPKLRKQKEKVKNVTKRAKETINNINKQTVEKNLDKITLNVNKLLRREMRADDIKMKDIIRKHYTEVDRTGKTLAQKIVDGLGVNPRDAQIAAQHIADSFNILTQGAKTKALQAMLGRAKNKPKPGEKDSIQKIIELSNLGAMDDAQFADIVAKRMGVPSITPEHMFAVSKQSQKIQEMQNDPAANGGDIIDEIGKLYGMLYTDVPRTFRQKAMDVRVLSMLANAKSAERNVTGQGGDTLVTNIAKEIIGRPVDKFITWALSKKIGVQQERTMGPTEWRELWRKTIEGFKHGTGDIKKGIYTTGIRIEKELGVKLPKDAEKFGMGKQEWKPGGIGEMAQRGVGYLLQSPDAAFQEGVFWESYRNQLNALRPETRQNLPQALKQKMAEQAWREASTVTYRKMNAFSTAIVGIQRKMGTIGKLVLTFPKVAANILYSGLYQYSPVGLAVTGNRIRKFIKSGGVETVPTKTSQHAINQRQLAFDFSRAGIGTAITTLGVLAGYTAAVTGGRDDDTNVQKTQETLGKQPGAVRIGGHYYRYDWAQPLSIPFELGVEIGKALRKGGNEDFAENVINVLTTAASSIVDQPLFATGKRIASAPGRKSGEKILGGIEALISSSAASFIPTLSGQARQLVDRYQRNIFRSYGKGQVNTLRAWGFNAGAMILNKIPFASTLLEKRKDIFGRPMEYHKSSNLLFDALDRFSNPAIMTDVRRDPGVEYVLKLNEDKPVGMTEKPLPRNLERTWYLERDRKRYYMTPALRSKYQEEVGKEVYDFIKEYYDRGMGDGLSVEEQVKEIYDEISKIGKDKREEMLEEMGAE